MQHLQHGEPLLGAYPVVRTDSRNRMKDALHSTYKVRSAEFDTSSGVFFGIANRVDLDGLSLHYCHYGADARIAFPGMEGFRQLLCLRGHGSLTVDGRRLGLDPRTTALLPPYKRFDAHYSADYAHLVLAFNPDRLVKYQEYMTGTDAARAVALPTLVPLESQRLDRFVAVALALACQMSRREGVSTIVVKELEDVLLRSFLHEHHRSFPDLLRAQPRLVDNRQVRTAEDFIAANWNRPITVEEIARVTGVSVRSIFGTFRKTRGCTPMAFLRDVRLDRARQELMERGSADSVADIAAACGFQSFGHFARHYRERFGELPSATLARSRIDRPATPGPRARTGS